MGASGIVTSLLLAGIATLIAIVLRGKLGNSFSKLDFRKSEFREAVGLIFTVILISAFSSALVVVFLFALMIGVTSILGYSQWAKEIIDLWLVLSAYIFVFGVYFVLGINGYFKK